MNTDTTSTATTATTSPRRPMWRRVLKVSAWVLMAILLYAFGMVAATLSLLHPERLTPLLEHVAITPCVPT